MGHCTPAASQPAARSPAGTDLPATDSPPPPVPTDHAADAIYGAEAMAMGRHHLVDYHGGQKFSQVMLNIAEVQWRKGREAYEWDGEAWYGGDIGRFVLKSEGEGEFGGALEKAETQALYSHAIGPYWNLQGGVRYDIRPNPSRAYATIGVEGLAPSFFDVEAAVFLSNKGELLGKLEGYYDQRITQRLILQPRAELNFAAQDTPELHTGAGLSDAEVGLRLRYDIRREFAPYVGVQYRRAFGDTRRFLRADGEDTGGWSVLTGIRTWF
jgi:copper resistance protein B